MNDTCAAADGDVESILFRHVRNNGGNIATGTVTLFEVFAGPDGFFGVADGASDAVAVF